MRLRYLLIAAPVLAGVLFVLHAFSVMGSFRPIDPHFAGSCGRVPGLVGGEDITLHPERPLAYLSGYDRRAAFRGEDAAGGIYRYALDAPDAIPQKLDHGPLVDFQPHGISLYVDARGEETLFVVNHGQARHTLEVFGMVDGGLVHRRTLQSPLLVAPNDVHAVSPTRAYVTNDHGGDSKLMHSIENYLRLPMAGLVFVDGETVTAAAEGIRYANGVNQSPDGRRLYVASTTQTGILVYDRDPATNGLTLRDTLPIASGVDNIEVDSDGSLWVGAHPKLLDFVAHAKDRHRISPSQVLKITPDRDDGYRVEEIYLNDGQEISGSSVAASRGNRLLIGSVFEPYFLDCDLRAASR